MAITQKACGDFHVWKLCCQYSWQMRTWMGKNVRLEASLITALNLSCQCAEIDLFCFRTGHCVSISLRCTHSLRSPWLCLYDHYDIPRNPSCDSDHVAWAQSLLDVLGPISSSGFCLSFLSLLLSTKLCFHSEHGVDAKAL